MLCLPVDGVGLSSGRRVTARSPHRGVVGLAELDLLRRIPGRRVSTVTRWTRRYWPDAAVGSRALAFAGAVAVIVFQIACPIVIARQGSHLPSGTSRRSRTRRATARSPRPRARPIGTSMWSTRRSRSACSSARAAPLRRRSAAPPRAAGRVPGADRVPAVPRVGTADRMVVPRAVDPDAVRRLHGLRPGRRGARGRRRRARSAADVRVAGGLVRRRCVQEDLAGRARSRLVGAPQTRAVATRSHRCRRPRSVDGVGRHDAIGQVLTYRDAAAGSTRASPDRCSARHGRRGAVRAAARGASVRRHALSIVDPDPARRRVVGIWSAARRPTSPTAWPRPRRSPRCWCSARCCRRSS